MKEALNNWWLVLVKGIILVLLAIFVLTNPVEALVGLALYIGLGLLFTGVILLFVALSIRKTDDNWGWRLAEGIMDILFAIVLLSNPGVTAAVIPFVVGFWMMIAGVIIFVNSFGNKNEGVSTWWPGLISGLLTVMIGYFITANIFAGAIAVTMWIGIGFLIAGIISISTSFRMRSLKKAVDA